jgi:hypothetical protein
MLDRTQRGRDRTCLFRDDERPTTFGERGPRQRHSPLSPSAGSVGVRVSRQNSSPSPRLPTLRLAAAVGTVPIALGLRRRQPHSPGTTRVKGCVSPSRHRVRLTQRRCIPKDAKRSDSAGNAAPSILQAPSHRCRIGLEPSSTGQGALPARRWRVVKKSRSALLPQRGCECYIKPMPQGID